MLFRRVRLLALVGLVAVTVAACDWPMYGFGPSHAGVSTDTSISKTAAASGFNPSWIGRTNEHVESSPAVVGSVVYVGSDRLYAFDTAGPTGCSGTPATCAPLWTAATGGSVGSSPAVVDGVVYVTTGSPDDKLYAFDAAGKTNCSGIPKTCAPLWTATTMGQLTAPVVAHDIVYVAAGRLFAFDARGTTNCSGTPKTCQPLWTTADNASFYTPAVADGFVYVGANIDAFFAYDADGDQNCSGVPKICAPLWAGSVGPHFVSPPAVANGVVYVGSYDQPPYEGITAQPLRAFDASGKTNCSGTPKHCAPLWVTSVGATNLPAIANGVLYASNANGALYAFDATGRSQCSGTPKVCTPVWSALTTGETQGSPSVANGVVYLGSLNGLMPDGWLYAFDATGVTNCSGNPKQCTPLSMTAVPGSSGASSAAIVNGIVYIGAFDTNLYAFRPKSP